MGVPFDGIKPEHLRRSGGQFVHHSEDVFGVELLGRASLRGSVPFFKDEEVQVALLFPEVVGQAVPHQAPDPSFQRAFEGVEVYFFKNPQKSVVHDAHCFLPVVGAAQAHFHHRRKKPPVQMLLHLAVVRRAALYKLFVRVFFFEQWVL